MQQSSVAVSLSVQHCSDVENIICFGSQDAKQLLIASAFVGFLISKVCVYS